jgi:hypothetical protein
MRTFQLGQQVRDVGGNTLYYRLDGMVGTVVQIIPQTDEPELGPLYEVAYGEGPGDRLGYGFMGTGLMRSYANEIEAVEEARR